MLKKIACNATNSAAIDDNGNLWVWGSTRYGLCGAGDQPGLDCPSMNKPTKMRLLQTDTLAQFHVQDRGPEPGQEFNAFALLDPDPNNGDQVFCAQHISYGSYHAGVVCNDISTDYEFTPLGLGEKDILDEFEAFLLRYWKELEKQNLKEIAIIQAQYYQKQKNFMQGQTQDFTEVKQGEVSKQLKIEYMLRFFSRVYLKSTFPFVPLQFLKDIMVKQANMMFKDVYNINKIYSHLTKCADTVLAKSNMSAKRKFYQQCNKGDDYVNLKELRDQIMGRRCSNGQLYMYGISNEGRLGINTIKDKGKGDDKKGMVPLGLQLVQFPDPTILIKKVECGSSFTLTLTETGHMYSWGFGKSGSLGLGEQSLSLTPALIQQLYSGEACQNMTDISCGSSHSLSIDSGGKIYSWGNGQGGRLGHDAQVGENTPRKIKALQGKFIKYIEAGDASSAAVTHDYQVYMWGSGLNGRLGNGTSTHELRPQLSQELKDRQVSCVVKGTNTTFAILETNQVLGWGSSKNGKLGFHLANGKNYDLPKEIISLKDVEVYQIASGPFHTLLLTVDGKIYTMGNSKDGKLGYEVVGGSVVDVELPERLKDPIMFFRIQIQKTVLKQYPLFNDYDDYSKLKVVCTRSYNGGSYEVNQISCGENFQLFLTNSGHAYSCGSNKFGQLGTEDDSDDEGSDSDEKKKGGDDDLDEANYMPEQIQKKLGALEKRQDRWEPKKIEISGISGTTKIRYVSVGAMHAFAIIENDNGVVSWGQNTFGQCGIGQKTDSVFRPTKLKSFGQESMVRQIACGEIHTIFLMGNGSVMTCGSNEFGQLGLYQDAAIGDGAHAYGGQQNFNTPTLIEKQYLDNVQYVAAGRFHSMAVRKQTLGDFHKENGGEGGGAEKEVNKCNTADGIDPDAAGDSRADAGDSNIKVIVVDIRHDLYGWGRGYHGQLGLRDLKVVQWLPTRVKLKKDPRFKDEDQPTRFAMISCGEKHTLLLAVNGLIWWSGEKGSVGMRDPNANRKNQFEAKNETASYQYSFVPYFDPTAYGEFHGVKIKFISSNFNSQLNFAITEGNNLCVFGVNTPFQKFDSDGRFVFANSGKDYFSLIHIERLPYTWGDTKNGKLGLDLEGPDVIEEDPHPEIRAAFIAQRTKLHNKKLRRVTGPCRIPHFVIAREECQVPTLQAELYRQKYLQVSQLDEVAEEDESEIANFELRFPIQQKLKLQDQSQLEKDLIQQDVDLVINFKGCIQGIFETQKANDRQIRNSVMKAQDSISSRIQTFPIANVEKLEDVDMQIPKILILNKQIYEVLFSLLQTHPCYLINWICAAIRQEVDLFDDHPQAFEDETGDSTAIGNEESGYANVQEVQIQHDEYCYLLVAVFGGLKTIRNDRRILNTLMMIASKVFEFELAASTAAERKIEYTFDDIMYNRVEPVFIKIQRLIYQSQQQNISFIDELFELIVRALYRDRRLYTDGIQSTIRLHDEGASMKDRTLPALDLFDYESVIADARVTELRSLNLLRFCKHILEEILIKNLDPKLRTKKTADCEFLFSNELLLMTIRARVNLLEKAAQVQKRTNIRTMPLSQKAAFEQKQKESSDQINQFCLRALFEDLFLKLQHLKPHDIIKIVGQKQYDTSGVLVVAKKRNNFFYVGEALRQVMTGGRIHFSNPVLESYKDFIGQKEVNYRTKLMDLIVSHKGKDEMLNFNQILVQQSIEEALEITNPACTVQLRNIVYVHNQLVSYGEKHVYVKGFESDLMMDDDRLDGRDEGQRAAQNQGSEEGSDAEENESHSSEELEMDPIKMLMNQLGNQYIILKVYEKEYISQKTLDKSVNLLIRTRIFENFSEIAKCSGCNAVVYEGLIPKQRFHEGLNMKQWHCGNKKCGHLNTVETSLTCKKCDSPRPKSTLPLDLIFPLYLPLNPTIEINRQATVMEKLLQMMPLIDVAQGIEEFLKDTKTKEKAKQVKDFDKINIIDDFLGMRSKYIQTKKAEQGPPKGDDPEAEEKMERHIEEVFYDLLVDKIQQNIERRLEHQAILDKNVQMIREIVERSQYIELRQKQLIQSINRIQSNAKHGIGSDSLLSEAGPENRIYAGQLEELPWPEKPKDKDKKEKEAKKEKQESPSKKNPASQKNAALANYFEDMEAKQTMTMNNPKLQKQLDENRERRAIMKAQFGQFSSYPAQKLVDDGVVVSVKIGGQKIETIMKKCNYLFYELVPSAEVDGGYKVELSFEEKMADFCGVGSILSPGQKQVGSNNQSILSTFTISNETLVEMRRVMATKCTVHLGGTVFNIFKLVKLINQMKTQNQQYSDAKPKKG